MPHTLINSTHQMHYLKNLSLGLSLNITKTMLALYRILRASINISNRPSEQQDKTQDFKTWATKLEFLHHTDGSLNRVMQ
jgi:hypothetical protein